ncbi:MAG: YicC/YloC family endoribonuclease, partial [Bryobacteraceae bacterium]
MSILNMASPLRSMTGFARSRKTIDTGEIIVSVKSLNHRGLDVQVHAPSAADEFENAIRAMVKARLVRGHVEVRISLPPSGANGSAALALNHDLLRQYLKAFHEAAQAHGIHAEPDLNAAFRHTGMLAEAAPESASNSAI